ncbi:type I-E CRISPR-associated protein Cas5/CasD [Spongiactinospora gelatinilytica]|uniref:Type I-E CRISPR-associated protein Cas5/CasD n=1 Tax=Spongiactinospora gelatinilytica TaxID=2666298 RepID=A0A2W2GFQ9_9ACTN|nr:type I-E CRISPR-associated protein Cas5/CasD [Spongiactinospora gelatinilytica]PZG41389.1 type I-E CRISPR-associated protein Cas5/CasD [Spongiactinospora gelatinilytica]
MIASLPLCFDGPMQSWGIRSRGIIRDTMPEPTKSGVVGLMAAAMGIDRDDDAALAELARLRLAVRVDREGVMERDYHTAQNVPTTQGTGHRTVVSERYYLADALFLVVLEGEESMLDRVAAAVRNPHWPLSFGRKAYVPARPLLEPGGGPEPEPAEEILKRHQWLVRRDTPAEPLRTVVECPPGTPGAEVRYDQPVSFRANDRRFAARAVRIGEVVLTGEGAGRCS